MPQPLIPPSNGRIVWFTPPRHHTSVVPVAQYDTSQPLAAMIVHVWSDRMVNLVVLDSVGVAHSFTSVQLLQEDDLKPEWGRFATWMPYQLGQAAKAA